MKKHYTLEEIAETRAFLADTYKDGLGLSFMPLTQENVHIFRSSLDFAMWDFSRRARALWQTIVKAVAEALDL